MVATTWAWLTGYASIEWLSRAEYKLALVNAIPLQLLESKKLEAMATSRRVHVMAAHCQL